ncbi:MAG TPA: hypothetical protein VMR62_35215 [Bryobacteraceae bacterium]|jgi:pimeloyl-ACP methyl ester carboxylesterase|nr:hypothetical protein [Bryobacteraceae bacterium]
MQDYGGTVGFRMALTHPERVEALIVQDAVAQNEGLGANWKTRRAFWADRAANESTLRTNLLSLPTTRTRHVGNDPNVERYDPDLWTDEFAFLNQPGQADIQSDLFTTTARTHRGSWPVPSVRHGAFGRDNVCLASMYFGAEQSQLRLYLHIVN